MAWKFGRTQTKNPTPASFVFWVRVYTAANIILPYFSVSTQAQNVPIDKVTSMEDNGSKEIPNRD